MTPKDELSKRLRATRDHADTWWVSLCEEAADALDERDARIADLREALQRLADSVAHVRLHDAPISTLCGPHLQAVNSLYPPLPDAALAETERSETGGSV